VAGLQFGLGFAKTIFWGKGFGKNSADLPPAERGLGNECGRARTLQNRWDKIRNIQKIEFVINCNYEKRN